MRWDDDDDNIAHFGDVDFPLKQEVPDIFDGRNPGIMQTSFCLSRYPIEAECYIFFSIKLVFLLTEDSSLGLLILPVQFVLFVLPETSITV